MRIVVCGILCGSALTARAEHATHNFNPYHERKLQEDIRISAAEVLSANDPEEKCLRQQDLCKKLIQAERYDDALKVANNIYQTPNVNAERKAAHHYLMADIYRRKMESSKTLNDMDENRKQALAVISQIEQERYPEKWGISSHANRLAKQLTDQGKYDQLKKRVATRQGLLQDTGKDAVADAQRKYLDATRGGASYSSKISGNGGAGVATLPSGGSRVSKAQDDLNLPSLSAGSKGSSDMGIIVKNESPRESLQASAKAEADAVRDFAGLPASPSVQRTFSTTESPTRRTSFSAGNSKTDAGVLTNQPGGYTTNISKDFRGSLLSNNVRTQEASGAGYVGNSLMERAAAASSLSGGRGGVGNISLSPTYATGEAPKR